MTRFFYKAKAGPAEVKEGYVEAPDRESAVTKIVHQGLMPLDVRVESKKSHSHKGVPVFQPFNKDRISSGDIMNFLWQMQDLVDADIPMMRALELLESQTQKPALKKVLNDIKILVRDGASLSQAMEMHSAVFPGYMTAMIRAGEWSGRLKNVLARLCRLKEKQVETAAKIKTALTYPALIVLVGFLTIFVLLAFVIPRLTVMFDDLGQDLPLITRILMVVSNLCAHLWWLLAAGVAGGIFWLQTFLQTPEGKRKGDQLYLKIPYVGEMIKISEGERFARVMGIMLESGVEVLPALDCGQGVVDNVWLKDEVVSVRARVQDGMAMAQAFGQSAFFPESIMTMIKVGEETGHPEAGFLKWADAYEREAERKTKIVTTLLEPALILVIGSIVGLIVMALLLPIFKMNVVIN